MGNNKGIIMAGNKIHAGIDEDDVTEIENCVVIYFEDKDDMSEFMKNNEWYPQD